MKKYTIHLFILVLLTLVTCTFLSTKIEDLMTVQVVLLDFGQIRGQGAFVRIPVNVLVQDEDGPHLFVAQKSTDWGGGLQAKELSNDLFAIDVKHNLVSASTGYGRFIMYSCKPLQNGVKVKPWSLYSYTDDFYLVVYSGNVPELLEHEITVVAQGENVLLLSVQDAILPFMEDRAKDIISEFENLTDYSGVTLYTGTEKRIYSLLEMRQFAKALPVLAILLTLLFLSVVIWGCSCFLLQKVEHNKALLLTNYIVMIVLVASLPMNLNAINLPSSFLPKSNILDLEHYINEFIQISKAFENLPSLPLLAKDMLKTMEQMMFSFVIIIIVGVILSIGLVFGELYFSRRLTSQN